MTGDSDSSPGSEFNGFSPVAQLPCTPALASEVAKSVGPVLSNLLAEQSDTIGTLSVTGSLPATGNLPVTAVSLAVSVQPVLPVKSPATTAHTLSSGQPVIFAESRTGQSLITGPVQSGTGHVRSTTG